MRTPRWLADHEALSRAYLACKTDEAVIILRDHIVAAQGEGQRKVPTDQTEGEMTF